MNIINGFNSKNKQIDKMVIELRISKLTLLKLAIDLSRKEFLFIIFNIGIKIG